MPEEKPDTNVAAEEMIHSFLRDLESARGDQSSTNLIIQSFNRKIAALLGNPETQEIGEAIQRFAAALQRALKSLPKRDPERRTQHLSDLRKTFWPKVDVSISCSNLIEKFILFKYPNCTKETLTVYHLIAAFSANGVFCTDEFREMRRVSDNVIREMIEVFKKNDIITPDNRWNQQFLAQNPQ